MSLSPSFLFSQSNLQDYVDCPRRFYLKHIRRLAWPSIESEPVQDNERFRLQGERFHRLVHQLLIGIPVERLNPFSADILLASWWENFLSSQKELLALPRSLLQPERSIATIHAGFRLLAKYDLLVFRADGSLLIYDWKTYRNRPRRQSLAQKLQTRLYPFVLVHTNLAPGDLSLIYWYANFPAQPEVFPYSQAQYQQDERYLSQLIETIAGAADSDSEEAFPLTVSPERCLFCVYRSLCNRGIRAGEDDSFDQELDLDLDDFNFEHISEVEF